MTMWIDVPGVFKNSWNAIAIPVAKGWNAVAKSVAKVMVPIAKPIGKAWKIITKPFKRGWLTVPIAFCTMSSAVGLTVLALLIASSAKGDFSGLTGLFAGNCSKAKSRSETLRFAVTAAAFLLTLSSDKFLRLAVAPLPEEVDRAHARSQWLDIGVNSWRNIPFVSAWRRWSWAIILLTSVPVQLLSNSAITLTTTSTNYREVIASQQFVDGGPWQVPGIATLYYGNNWLPHNDTMTSMVTTIQQQVQNSNWTRMDPDECRRTYLTLPNGLQYYRNLVIVIEAGPNANTTGWTGAEVWSGGLPKYYTNISSSTYNPNASNTLWYLQQYCYYGICSGNMGYSGTFTLPPPYDFKPWQFQWVESYYYLGHLSDAPNFSAAYDTVTGLYCLVEPFEAPCRIGVINGFVFLVCLCIFVKSTTAIVMMICLRHTEPIQCLGDLIQRQLRRRDDVSLSGLCTYDQDWFLAYNPAHAAQNSDRMRMPWTGQPRAWDGSEKRWRNAVPRQVWLTTYTLIAVVLATVSVLLGIGIDHNSYFNKGPFGEGGFGTNPNNGRLNLFGGRVPSAIVANLPQSILTACYFWFTGVFTRMFQAREWALFAEKPNMLKVTDPQGPSQRSSDLLGAPLFWGGLFVAFSVALHWSVGQSLYVVAKEVLPVDSNDFVADSLTFGLQFSTQAILLTLVLATASTLIPVLLSLRTLPRDSIVVGSNSAAIAAQCQRPRGPTGSNYGTMHNDDAVAIAGTEGGEGDDEDEPDDDAGSDIAASSIEMDDMGEATMRAAEQAEPQEDDDTTRPVHAANGELVEQVAAGGSRPQSRLLPPSAGQSDPRL